ncbi:hypothetical protein ACJMK2_019893 [Sinanodonta woodiana]|uniref:Uncharacterized protein n=1 Tax=Sinanodonta woodiana TaxID=1069815 RepID=A0ABD3U027_SINWO
MIVQNRVQQNNLPVTAQSDSLRPGGFVVYHLIATGEDLYETQHQQKTTQSQLGVFNAVGTTDSSKQLRATSTDKGLVISKSIPGLEGYTGQNADHMTSSWNRNQVTNRTTTEATLGESNRLNTTLKPGDSVPVITTKGFLINKPVLRQDINDVINPGYEVTDGGRGSQKHASLNQHLDLKTVELQLGALHRVNTTHLIYPVTNNQSQNRTATEPHLETVDKINTSNAFEEFDRASTIQAQSWTGTTSRLTVLDKLNTTDAFEEFDTETNNTTQINEETESTLTVFDRSITKSVSEVFEPERENHNQNLTATEPLLQLFDKTNTTQIFEEFEQETNNQAWNQTAVYTKLGVFKRINTTEDPEKNNQDQNRIPNQFQLRIFDKINTTDLYEEFELETNNQVQNRTIIEPLLGVSGPINTTDVSKTSEPAGNNQAHNRTVTAAHFFSIINTTNESEKSEPGANNRTQEHKIKDPQLVVLDRINTTEVKKEVDPMGNFKGVVSTKPDHGQKMSTDISAEGHTISNGDQVGDTSSLLNQTKNRITFSRLGAFDTGNATDVPDTMEPISNSVGVVINQSVSGPEIHNATALYGSGHSRELVKQGVTQGTDNQTTQMNGSVTTKHVLVTKQNESKGKVQVQSINRKKKANMVAQTKNSKKRGQPKGTNKKQKKENKIGHTVIKAEKGNRNSSHNLRAQNRNNTLLGTFDRTNATNDRTNATNDRTNATNDRTNATNISDVFYPVTNGTGVVLSQLVPVQEIRKDTLIPGNIIMNQKVHYISLSPNRTQNGTRPESHLGAIDITNTTDVKEELEPVTNSTGVAVNESIHGKQRQNDTLFSGYHFIDRENISDVSLSQNQTQNRTTMEPYFGTLIKGNATHDPDGPKPITNLTSVVVDPIVPGTEIHNAALRSANDIGSKLIKQGIAKKPDKVGANKAEGNVRIVNSLNTKGKNLKTQVQLHSSVRTKQQNEKAKSKSDRKQGNGTLSRLIKEGTTISRAFESGANATESRGRIVTTLATKRNDTNGLINSAISEKQGNEEVKTNIERKQGDTVINPNEVSQKYVSTTRPQNQTTKETNPHGSFDRVNASDVTSYELKLATTSIDQPVPRQEINTDAFILARMISTHENVSVPLASQNQTQNLTTKESSFEPFYRINATDDFEELESAANTTGVGINMSGSEQMRKDKLLPAPAKNIHENASKASLSTNQTQNWTTKESGLVPFYRVKQPDDIDEVELMTNFTGVVINESLSGRQIQKDALFSAPTKNIHEENASKASLSTNQTQNWTTEESGLGPFYRVKQPDDIDEVESLTNFTGVVINESLSGRHLRKDDLFSAHTASIQALDNDTSGTLKVSQNQTTKESHLGTFYKVSTTKHMEESELLVNTTGVGINETLSGRQILKDVLFSGHTTGNPEKISDTTLYPNQTQIQTTKEPRIGAIYRINTTNATEVMEPVNNFNQTIPGQERNNATLKPAIEIMNILTTQRATTLQAAESGAHQTNGSVRTVNTLFMKENDTNSHVQLHTTTKKKQRNKPTKAKNSKKQSRRKATDHKIGNN